MESVFKLIILTGETHLPETKTGQGTRVLTEINLPALQDEWQLGERCLSLDLSGPLDRPLDCWSLAAIGCRGSAKVRGKL